MTSGALRVGIIGASARGGWARESHVPAVQGLPGLELAAVAGSSQDSADAAAAAFGAPRGYGRAEDLLADPAVDLVTVAIKVPGHRELVAGALAAGKHVYCEWPLGRDVPETDDLRAAAEKAGVHAAIGLQARMSPATRRARELVASGSIGRVLQARLYDSTVAFSPSIGQGDRYLEDPANGATLIGIHGGHALDLTAAVLGEPTGLTSLTTIQYPVVAVGDDRLHRTVADHLLVVARLPGDAPLSVEVVGGRPPADAAFHLQIVGTDATLSLHGGDPRGFQGGRIRLSRDGAPEHVDEGETASLPDGAASVGAVYAALRDDIADGTSHTPGFDHAAGLARRVAELDALRPTRLGEPVSAP